MSSRLHVLVFLVSAAGCPAPPPAAPAPVIAPPASSPAAPPARLSLLEPLFRVELEQDGAVVPIRDHEARLARRPFTIVVHARDPRDGILMNASRSPELFEKARSGQELLSSFQPGTGMAEDAVVRHRTLYLGSAMAHHYLIYGEGINRYHAVEKVGSRYRCLRRVEALEQVAEGRVLPLSEVDVLHLVFFLGTSNGAVERRRESIRIRFASSGR